MVDVRVGGVFKTLQNDSMLLLPVQMVLFLSIGHSSMEVVELNIQEDNNCPRKDCFQMKISCFCEMHIPCLGNKK